MKHAKSGSPSPTLPLQATVRVTYRAYSPCPSHPQRDDQGWCGPNDSSLTVRTARPTRTTIGLSSRLHRCAGSCSSRRRRRPRDICSARMTDSKKCRVGGTLYTHPHDAAKRRKGMRRGKEGQAFMHAVSVTLVTVGQDFLHSITAADTTWAWNAGWGVSRTHTKPATLLP